MSSSVTGPRPAAASPATACPAASSDGKKAISVARGGGAGRSRRVASVTIAERPLRADDSGISPYPATSFTFLPPSRMSVPSAITTSRPRTASRVTPYFTQHSPPAFVPRLPPIVHCS